MTPRPKITIYTDGSYRGKLRSGGYAALILDRYGNYMLVGDGMMNTTISRMELSAAIVGLSYLQDGCDVQIVSDSQYVVNIVNKWLKGWQETNFMKANGEEVSNQDLLQQLAWHIDRMHRVRAAHVMSHTGYTDEQSLGNDVCDHFAVQNAIRAYEQSYI